LIKQIKIDFKTEASIEKKARDVWFRFLSLFDKEKINIPFLN
jgi:hypothetical protein